jgi:tetratricopeptide (TPR) repeat protein
MPMGWWSKLLRTSPPGASGGHAEPSPRADPAQLVALVERAGLARLAGETETAREAIEQALAESPEHPLALVESACQHRLAGRYADALRLLDHALMSAPEPARVHLEIGKAHIAARDLIAAVDALTLATALEPTLGEAWLQLGDTLGRLDRNSEAVDALARAVESAPEPMQADAWFQYGQALHMLRRLPEASAAYHESLSRRPDSVFTLMAAGNSELLQENDEAALGFYERALALGPPVPMGLHLHLAMAYQYVGRWRDAQHTYERLLALTPNDNLARWYLSQCDLALCNWERGWSAYGTRFAAGASPYRPLPFKPWRGDSVPEDTLLVLADQGLGDEIMFAWCVPEAMARVKHCIVECEPRLERLFRRSFPGATIVPSERLLDGKWLHDLPEPQWQIFGGDLCGLFRRSEADFKPHAGYLKADPARVDYWRRRLCDDLGPGLKVGVSWRGGSDKTRTRSRSIEPRDWEPILTTPGCRFVNLQYGNYLPELHAINERFGPVVHDYPEALADYDETAALVTALDLVTTVCTAIVHLGGALGRPVWVLVPFSPGWRYTVERERMPWYPSTRLFRQKAIGDWSSPCRTLSEELERMTQNVGMTRV